MGAVLNRKHFLAPLFLATIIAAGQAGASSIVKLEAMAEAVGPSMVVLPALEPESAAIVPGAPPEAVSRSVVAVGEPAVTLEETAAVDDDDRPHGQQPMVIRGGVVGDAVIRAAPSAAPIEPTAQPETAEAPAMTPPPEPQTPPPLRTRDAERPVPVMRPE